MYFGMAKDTWLSWMEEINTEMEIKRHAREKECKLYEILYLSTVVDYVGMFPESETQQWPPWYREVTKSERSCSYYYKKHNKTEVFKDAIMDKISKEDNVIIRVAGDTGSGKSILGLSMANMFDRNMHKGRFGNSNRDIIANITNAKKEPIVGPKFLLRDEILKERGADSHVSEDIKDSTMVALRKARISMIECCPDFALDEKFAFSLRMIDNNYFFRKFPETQMTIEEQVDWYLKHPAIMRALVYKSPKGGVTHHTLYDEPWGFVEIPQIGWRMDSKGNMSVVEKERQLLIDYTRFKEEQNEKIANMGISNKDFKPFFIELLHQAFSCEERIENDVLEMFQVKAEEGDVILTKVNMAGAGDVIEEYAENNDRWHGITSDMVKIMSRKLRRYCMKIKLKNVPLSRFMNDPDYIREFTSREVDLDE